MVLVGSRPGQAVSRGSPGSSEAKKTTAKALALESIVLYVDPSGKIVERERSYTEVHYRGGKSASATVFRGGWEAAIRKKEMEMEQAKTITHRLGLASDVNEMYRKMHAGETWEPEVIVKSAQDKRKESLPPVDPQKFPTHPAGALGSQGMTHVVATGGRPRTTKEKIEAATPSLSAKQRLEEEVQAGAIKIFEKKAKERAAKEGREPTPLVTHKGTVAVKQIGTDKYEKEPIVLAGPGKTTHEAVRKKAVEREVLAKEALISSQKAARKKQIVEETLGASPTEVKEVEVAPESALVVGRDEEGRPVLGMKQSGGVGAELLGAPRESADNRVKAALSVGVEGFKVGGGLVVKREPVGWTSTTSTTSTTKPSLIAMGMFSGRIPQEPGTTRTTTWEEAENVRKRLTPGDIKAVERATPGVSKFTREWVKTKYALQKKVLREEGAKSAGKSMTWLGGGIGAITAFGAGYAVGGPLLAPQTMVYGAVKGGTVGYAAGYLGRKAGYWVQDVAEKGLSKIPGKYKEPIVKSVAMGLGPIGVAGYYAQTKFLQKGASPEERFGSMAGFMGGLAATGAIHYVGMSAVAAAEQQYIASRYPTYTEVSGVRNIVHQKIRGGTIAKGQVVGTHYQGTPYGYAKSGMTGELVVKKIGGTTQITHTHVMTPEFGSIFSKMAHPFKVAPKVRVGSRTLNLKFMEKPLNLNIYKKEVIASIQKGSIKESSGYYFPPITPGTGKTLSGVTTTRVMGKPTVGVSSGTWGRPETILEQTKMAGLSDISKVVKPKPSTPTGAGVGVRKFVGGSGKGVGLEPAIKSPRQWMLQSSKPFTSTGTQRIIETSPTRLVGGDVGRLRLTGKVQEPGSSLTVKNLALGKKLRSDVPAGGITSRYYDIVGVSKGVQASTQLSPSKALTKADVVKPPRLRFYGHSIGGKPTYTPTTKPISLKASDVQREVMLLKTKTPSLFSGKEIYKAVGRRDFSSVIGKSTGKEILYKPNVIDKTLPDTKIIRPGGPEIVGRLKFDYHTFKTIPTAGGKSISQTIPDSKIMIGGRKTIVPRIGTTTVGMQGKSTILNQEYYKIGSTKEHYILGEYKTKPLKPSTTLERYRVRVLEGPTPPPSRVPASRDLFKGTLAMKHGVWVDKGGKMAFVHMKNIPQPSSKFPSPLDTRTSVVLDLKSKTMKGPDLSGVSQSLSDMESYLTSNIRSGGALKYTAIYTPTSRIKVSGKRASKPFRGSMYYPRYDIIEDMDYVSLRYPPGSIVPQSIASRSVERLDVKRDKIVSVGTQFPRMFEKSGSDVLSIPELMQASGTAPKDITITSQTPLTLPAQEIKQLTLTTPIQKPIIEQKPRDIVIQSQFQSITPITPFKPPPTITVPPGKPDISWWSGGMTGYTGEMLHPPWLPGGFGGKVKTKTKKRKGKAKNPWDDIFPKQWHVLPFKQKRKKRKKGWIF